MEEKHKFDIQDMLSIGLVLVVTGIALAFGLQVTSDVQANMEPDSSAYNATQDAIDGISVLPQNLPTVALVAVAAIIIGILVRYLFVRLTR